MRVNKRAEMTNHNTRYKSSNLMRSELSIHLQYKRNTNTTKLFIQKKLVIQWMHYHKMEWYKYLIRMINVKFIYN